MISVTVLVLGLPLLASATSTHEQGLGAAFPGETTSALTSFNEATEEFEGFLKFEFISGPLEGSKFGCEVTLAISAEGGTTAEVPEFAFTTMACESKSPMYNDCIIVDDEWSLPLNAHGESGGIVMANGAEDITMKITFTACDSGLPGLDIKFESIGLTPYPESGPISTLTVGAVSNSSPTMAVSGILDAETDEELELIP